MSAAAKKVVQAKKFVNPGINNTESKPGPLFVNTKFTSSAGLELLWKVECDTMEPGDWECLADRVAERFTFQIVQGVPKGKPTGKDNGEAFAKACRAHATDDGDRWAVSRSFLPM